MQEPVEANMEQATFFVKLMFKAFMEKKIRAAFEKSLGHLAALCEKSAR